nr:hypothetical protein [Pediococcus acidilactici]
MSKPRTRWYTTVSIVVMFLFSLTVTSAKAQSNPADLDSICHHHYQTTQKSPIR